MSVLLFIMRFALLAGGLPLVAGMATPIVHQRASPSVVVSLVSPYLQY